MKRKELEELEECYHILLLLLLMEDPFKEVLLKPVFNPSKLGEGLLEFEKRKDKGILNKNLA